MEGPAHRPRRLLLGWDMSSPTGSKTAQILIAVTLVVAVVILIPSPSSSAFVTRVGTQLDLAGSPFRFEGFNIYNANSNGGCVPKADLAQSLAAIGTGQKVIRVFFFQPWATKNGARDWTAFDQTLATAKAYGVKVIPVLANQWAYCDGSSVPRYLAWYQTGYRTQVDTGSLVSYRDWVAEMVSRYANDPTIAFWQLVNEGEARNPDGTCSETTAASALRAFADDVGGLVHSLDPNHLVSLGTISGECGSNEGHYQTIYASPSIDICDYHDYRFPTSPMGNTDPQNGLQTTIDRCHAINKPIFVGETGIHGQPGAYSLTDRAAYFDAKFTAQFSAGVVGELMWNWSLTPGSCGTACNYEIGPGDPSLGLLNRY